MKMCLPALILVIREDRSRTSMLTRITVRSMRTKKFGRYIVLIERLIGVFLVTKKDVRSHSDLA